MEPASGGATGAGGHVAVQPGGAMVRAGRHRHYQAPQRPWYAHKPHPSFADMLATLKGQSLDQTLFTRADQHQGCENTDETRKILQQLLC